MARVQQQETKTTAASSHMPMDPMTFLLFLLESLDDDGAAEAAAAVEETPWPDQLTIVGFDGLVKR